jgi:hypothetical protein
VTIAGGVLRWFVLWVRSANRSLNKKTPLWHPLCYFGESTLARSIATLLTSALGTKGFLFVGLGELHRRASLSRLFGNQANCGVE